MRRQQTGLSFVRELVILSSADVQRVVVMHHPVERTFDVRKSLRISISERLCSVNEMRL